MHTPIDPKMDVDEITIATQEVEEVPMGPNERLAAQVVASLLERNLITPSDANRVSMALRSGKIKQEDWSGWIINGIKAGQTV